MHRAVRAGLAGASFANLLFIGLWSDFFRYRTPDAFFLDLSPADLIGAIGNVLLAGVAVGLISYALGRCDRLAVPQLADILLGISALLLANILRQAFRLTPDKAGPWLGALSPSLLIGLMLIAVVTAAVLLGWSEGRLAGWISSGYLILSPFLLITLGRSFWLVGSGRLASQYASPQPAARLPQKTASGYRVVVILFDELDYRLGFEERPTGVTLPEFDRLKDQALFATNTTSPAHNTNEAMPSIVTGLQVSSLKSIDAREAELVLASGDSVPLDQVPTLFIKARTAGFNSGLVGWNLPYCRTRLGADLSACYWWPSGLLLGTQEGLVSRMLHHWASVFPRNSQIIHRLRVEGMLDRALQLVQDPDLNLIFVHFAVPHYPWIWNADAGRYDVTRLGAKGYFDNLALSDALLGKLRQALEKSGMDDRTVVILTSDHPWREARSYDGRSDDRVPLMIRFPGVGPGQTSDIPFNTVRLGDVCLAILNGRVGSPTQTVRWLEESRLTQ